MCFTDSGIVIELIAHPLNASSSIFSSVFGNSTSVNLLHPPKAAVPIIERPSGRLIVRIGTPLKAANPILLIDRGSIIDVKLLAPVKEGIYNRLLLNIL